MTIFDEKILKQAEEYHDALCKKYFWVQPHLPKQGCSLKIFL